MNQNRFTFSTENETLQVDINLTPQDYQKAEAAGIEPSRQPLRDNIRQQGIHTHGAIEKQGDFYGILAIPADEANEFDWNGRSFNDRSSGWRRFTMRYPDLALLIKEIMASRGTPEMIKRLEYIANKRWEEKVGQPDHELTKERVLQLENFRLQIGTRLFSLKEIGEDPEGTVLVEEVRKELQDKLDKNLRDLRAVLQSERVEEKAQKERLEERIRTAYPPPTLTDIAFVNQLSLWQITEEESTHLRLSAASMPVYLLPFKYAPEKVRHNIYEPSTATSDGLDYIEQAEIGKAQQKQLHKDTILLIFPTDNREYISGSILLHPDKNPPERFIHLHSSSDYDCVGDTASEVRNLPFTAEGVLQAKIKIARALRTINIEGLADRTPRDIPEVFWQDEDSIEPFHPRNPRRLSRDGRWQV